MSQATADRKMILATTHQSQDPYLSEIADFLCAALRGEAVAWKSLPDGCTEAGLLQYCERHQIQALLHHRLCASGGGKDWPRGFRDALEDSSKASVAQDIIRNHVLGRLLDHFEALGVRALLMKGEALARTHYEHPGSRVRCDSDLFISLQDLVVARKAVQDVGLNIVSPTFKGHQFTARRRDGSDHTVEIDVHWRILNAAKYARKISFEEAFEASRPVVGGRALADVDALLVACMHRWGSSSHERGRLIWLYDIHLLVSQMTSNDLQAFVSKAVALSVQDCCREGIERAIECFRTDVPREVLARLTPTGGARSPATLFAESNLGLLLDDWVRLPGISPRLNLLRELFAPPPVALQEKYGRTQKWYLPILYARHIVGGLVSRLTLK